MRAVVGRPTTLSVVIADALGNPSQVDDGTDVTVDIFDGAGVAVVTGEVATDDPVTGVYSYVLGPRPELDTFAVVWHATVGGYPTVSSDSLRLVGNRVLSPADIAADDVLQGLNATRRGEVLDAVEDLLADVIGYPAVLEGVRVDWDARRGTFAEGGSGSMITAGLGPAGLAGGGAGGERLIVPGIAQPRQVFSLSVNGAAASDDTIAAFRPGSGCFIWSGQHSWPGGHYEMWLSHGLPYVPGDLHDAAAILARYTAKRKIQSGKANAISERTASLTTEGAVIVFAVPTPERPTGLPEVDAVLRRYASTVVI